MNKNWEINHKLTSTIIIKNNQAVVKITQPYMNAFRDTEINIDDNTSVYFDTSNLSVIKLNNKIYRLEHFDIISFFLISNISHNVKINLKKINNIDIKIPKQYNCDFLIPPIEKYKKVIEEYCLIMDPRKINLIQEMLNKEVKEKKVMQENILKIQQNFLREKNQLQNDNNELFLKYIKIYNKIHSAKIRIQNQLSYKLGQAMIVNSKSILGYIRMPFVLSYIYDKHKQEQKIYQEKIKKDSSLILPPLESYPDYKEALKEKECFTYKLGQALIQANKTWYGGYIRLLFEIRKLKREFYIKKDIR
ncbi:sugar transferase [Campylobacter jejuni]|nr:sugar transferase [Campylobacter jejuni]EAI1888976.1 sugar transferase [Campylobacter jejuni]ELR8619543.1 sugar transferase [Campylobacter jejuni]EMA6306154.1 sugar transferase [Campylobacter jejuni]